MSLHYSGEVLIHKVLMGQWGNNGYVVVCPETNESIVIDTPPEPEKLLAVAQRTKVKAILITHTHSDHLVGFKAIRVALKAPVGVHASEAAQLPSPPDLKLADGDSVTAGTVTLRVIHAPGHTPGSLCYLTKGHLFTGDTLFPGGPGHTRTPQDLRQIVESIKVKLLVLPGETVVYPGHGADTTIEAAQKEYQIFASRPHPPELHGDVLWLRS